MDVQQIEKSVKSCCLGDKQAFERLISAHYKHVYLLCLSILTCAQDADHVTQQAFLKAYQDLGKLKTPSKFPSWIIQTAQNMCVNLLKNKKASGLLLKNIPERREQVIKFDDLQLAVKRIPDQLRFALFLYYFDGKNVNLMSNKTQLSAPEIYSQLRNGSRVLGKLLSEAGSKITAPCPDMLNRILTLAMSHSSVDEKKSIEIHTSSCTRCREYQQQITEQLDRLDGMCPYIEEDIKEGCRKTIEALDKLPNSVRPRYKTSLKKNLPTRVVITVIAAVFIIAGSILAIKYLPGMMKSKNPEVVKQPVEKSEEPGPEETDPPKSDQDLMLEQFKKANEFYTNSNSDELVRLLQSKYTPIRMIVAKFLSEVGNQKAIAPLQVLSEQWQGADQKNNPYLQAINSIMQRYAQDQPEEIIIEEPEIENETIEEKPVESNPPSNETTGQVKPDDEIRSITFTGQVVDNEDHPVMASVVTIKGFQMDDPEKWLSGVTDHHGNFTVSAPEQLKEMKFPIAIWAVIPNESEFIAWTLINPAPALIKDLPQKLPGRPGTTNDRDSCKTGVSDIRLIMEPAAVISGFVKDTSDNPVPNTEIEIRFSISDKSGRQKITSAYTWPVMSLTDHQGFFLAPNLPRLWANCLYDINASAFGFIPNSRQLKTSDILQQEQVDIQLMPPGPTVTGILFDNYGTPLSDRQVVAFINQQNPDLSVKTRTDTSGRFTLENCPPYPDLTILVKLSENPSGSDSEFIFYPDITVPVNYTPDQDEYNMELEAVLPELTFEVLVVDTEDNPVPDFTIQLKDSAGIISAQWQKKAQFIKPTDETGTCIFTDVPELEGIEVILDTRSSTNTAYSQYKTTKLSVNLNSGQIEYFVKAVLYSDQELPPDDSEGF